MLCHSNCYGVPIWSAILALAVCCPATAQFGGGRTQTQQQADDNPFGESEQEPADADPFQSRPQQFGRTGRGRPQVAASERDELSVLIKQARAAAAERAEKASGCFCAGDDSPSVRRIKDALTHPLESPLDFEDTHLEEIAEMLSDEYRIPIQLDAQPLDDMGIGPDEPITVDVNNITLKSALRLILNQLHLTYVIENEVLMITTPEEADTRLQLCVYDVRDLVASESGRMRSKTLIDAVISLVATETWANNGGGEAELRVLPPGLMAVTQTTSVHEEISEFLQTLRRARQAPERINDDGS